MWFRLSVSRYLPTIHILFAKFSGSKDVQGSFGTEGKFPLSTLFDMRGVATLAILVALSFTLLCLTVGSPFLR